MNQDRRSFLGQTGKLLVLTASAAIAWEHVLKGSPRRPRTTPPPTTGGGWRSTSRSASAAARASARARPRTTSRWRTSRSGPGSSATSSTRPTTSIRRSSSPNGGYDGFHEQEVTRPEPQDVLRAEAVQPLRGLAVRAGVPGRRDLREPGRRRAGGQDRTASAAATACRRARTAAASSIRAPNTVDKCSLCYHRITKGLTTACCETCPTGARVLADLKNPKDPIHAFLRDHKVQVLKPQMATGSKMFYNGLDGSVR